MKILDSEQGALVKEFGAMSLLARVSRANTVAELNRALIVTENVGLSSHVLKAIHMLINKRREELISNDRVKRGASYRIPLRLNSYDRQAFRKRRSLVRESLGSDLSRRRPHLAISF